LLALLRGSCTPEASLVRDFHNKVNYSSSINGSADLTDHKLLRVDHQNQFPVLLDVRLLHLIKLLFSESAAANVCSFSIKHHQPLDTLNAQINSLLSESVNFPPTTRHRHQHHRHQASSGQNMKYL